MCNKNKIHMALHSRTISTQLSTSARLNNSLVYSFLLLSPNPFDSSLFFTSFLSRLLYLIEAHIFHLYSGENFSRYLHYPLPFPTRILDERRKIAGEIPSRETDVELLHEMIFILERRMRIENVSFSFEQ